MSDPFDTNHPDYDETCGFVVCRVEHCSIQEVHPIHVVRNRGGRPPLSAAQRARRKRVRIRKLHRKMAQKHGEPDCTCKVCIGPVSTKCPRCGGKGWIGRAAESCPDCFGRGTINGIRAAALEQSHD